MTNPTDPLVEKVVVTRDDRDAAAALASVPALDWSKIARDEIRGGMHDEYAIVQAFARHRQAAIREAIEVLRPFAAKCDLISDDQDGDYTPDWSPFIAVKHYRAAQSLFAKFEQ